MLHRYVAWSFASNIFSSMENVLSSHSMLSVVSKADTEVLITANYMVKDMIGQLGGLAYVAKMGPQFDKHPRTIALHSTLAQQSSTVVECLTPLLPSAYFIPVAGLANVVKNVSFTGFGGINAKIIEKLADDKHGVGELYSKLSVVNTAGSTLGMILGLGVISKIPDHTLRMGVLPFIIWARIYTFNRSIEGIFNTPP